jgi:ribosomal protein S18 acetylase RimI-like enzyme
VSRADLALLARIHGQLHHGLAGAGTHREAGAFRLYLWPRDDAFYRTRALPARRPPGGWSDAIVRLRAACAAAGATPRLEILDELWPDLAGALLAAGFACELRATVLARPADAPAAPAADPATLLEEAAPDRLAAFIAAAEAAHGFAPRPIPPEEPARLAADIARGRTMLAAVLEDGRPVAGASLIGIGRDAELAAVWSAPERRRLGFAAAVCARLLAAFAARGGALVWLGTGDGAAERLYRRLGFVPVGTQLSFVHP